MRICLLSPIGLPAVGKSSFVTEFLLSTLLQSDFNVVHLCFDKLLYEKWSDYKQQRSELLELLKMLLQALKDSNSLPTTFLNSKQIAYHLQESKECSDYLIVCDDNNYYTSMRYKLYQICRQHEISYAQIYFQCPEAIAFERNAARLDFARVPDEIMHQMCARLEPPNAIINNWENNTFVLLITTKYSLNDVLEFLKNSFELQTTAPISTSVQVQKQSQSQAAVHELDLLLRKRIGVLMLKLNGVQKKKEMGTLLNEKRKEILANFKLDSNISHEACIDELDTYSNLKL